MIERTINELGGVFGQLAAMVSEQGYACSISVIDELMDCQGSKYNASMPTLKTSWTMFKVLSENL